jgi:hypothetical protein
VSDTTANLAAKNEKALQGRPSAEETLRLTTGFLRIKDPDKRAEILALVERYVGGALALAISTLLPSIDWLQALA